MAPLSILPGRVRFETNRLIGCEEGCVLLEESLLSMKGVSEASASHRTGRVLVRFDEGLVTRNEIEDHVKSALQAVATQVQKGTGAQFVRRKALSNGSSFHAGHLVMDLALHALLPAPLDLLLPAAATAMRW